MHAHIIQVENIHTMKSKFHFKSHILLICLVLLSCIAKAQTLGTDGWASRADGGWTQLPANDDESYQVTIPFSFCFNNISRTSLYINNNGNLSFDAPYFSFSPLGFPVADNFMIAPFWADVDTRSGGGAVYYKAYSNCLIVQWDSVARYTNTTPSPTIRNSFQVIISDGTSPAIPGGSVSFTYRRMLWTTGAAVISPATVGINLGDGVNYYLIGRFSDTTSVYNGANGLSGSGWLRGKTFISSGCKYNVYVDSTRATSGNGTTWATALKYVSEAVDMSNNNTAIDSIFVAKGTYYPTATTIPTPTQAQRDSAFVLRRSGVKMYGGYPNGGGVRNPATNPTILSGDIDNTPNDSSRNSYHIMVIAGITSITSSDSIVLDGFRFTKGSANTLGSTGYLTINNVGINRQYGGALYLRGNDSSGSRRFMFRNCTFTENYAALLGGAIYDSTAHPVISNTVFTTNRTAGSGGAMANIGSAKPSIINNSQFTYNTAASHGGSIYNSASSPLLTRVTFTNNRSAANGGAIYSTGTGAVSMRLTDFNYNYAANTGGAIYNDNIGVTIDSCNFLRDTAAVKGGALASLSGTSSISNSTFSRNLCVSATGNGGALDFSSGTHSVLKNTFSDNKSNGYGGAISYGTAVITIDSNTFAYDTAGVSGGAIYNLNSSGIIRNSAFSNNRALSTATATGGGAICLEGATSATPSIRGCTFSSNTAQYGGATLIQNNANVTTDSCFYNSNNAVTSGAAIYNSNVNASVYRTSFRGNTAPIANGGILYTTNSATGYIVNSLFAGNTSSGIFASSSGAIKVLNNTFSGNMVAAISMNNSTGVIMLNNILYGNANGIAVAGTAPTVTYSVVQGGYIGTGNTSGDPLFINAPAYTGAPFTTGDYRINFCSPAFNTGNLGTYSSNIGSTDIRGRNRTVNTVDMGAYEKQSDATSFGSNAALSNSSSNSLTFIATCVNSDWTYYASPNNPDSLSFAIRWGTNNTAARAAATLQVVVDAANTFSSTTPTSARAAMRRYWNINLNSTTMNEPVSVRFFYSPADTIAMRNQLTTAAVGLVRPLQWFKTTGNAYNPASVTDHNLNGGNYQLLTPVYGSSNNVAYVQFNGITTFSGGTASMDAGDATPLPLDLLDFRAKATGSKVQLNWELAGTENISRIEVERSTNGKDWNSIYSTKPTSSLNYQTWDEQPYAGSNYYRLKVWDNANKYDYSHTQHVIFKGEGQMNIRIYPNPNNGNFSIEAYGLKGAGTFVSIQDMLGKTISSHNISEGKTDITDLNLAAGTYMIRVQNGSTTHIEKLMVR